MIKNMKQFGHLQHSSSLQLIMITLLFTTTLAQSPASSPAPAALPQSPTSPPSPPAPPAPAAPPAPSGPPDLTVILKKAGRFSIMVRLLKSTHFIDQLNSLLNTSTQGITFFAPPDSAFSNLPSGTINSFTDQQKTELVQFHVLPSYVPLIQFQTLGNPVQTQAGNSINSQFPLNITTSGTTVNISTGIVNASVSGTVYTDGQLAVYQVDKVLLPLQFYVKHQPALAPAPSGSKKKKVPLPSITPTSFSGGVSVRITRCNVVSFIVAAIAVIAAIAS